MTATASPSQASPAHTRVNAWLALTALLSLVADGWSGKPSPLLHQLLLIPCTLTFLALLLLLLGKPTIHLQPLPIAAVLVGFECAAIVLEIAEARHFRQFGYHLTEFSILLTCGAILLLLLLAWFRPKPAVLIAGIAAVYTIGALVALYHFPLNYLRSDMLPVIGWADLRLWHRQNPYTTMHVGTRLYDFPYLPGMLVAFLPAVALKIDLRFANMVYLLAGALLMYRSTKSEFRDQISFVIGAFLLCPFLQYRHDLYLQPHWFAVIAAVVLMRRDHRYYAALLWGISCAIYQLSWVMVPFFVLYTFWQSGLYGSIKSSLLLGAGFLLVAGPFLPFAMRQMENNTVGQWNHLSHALADPINISYWLTYLIRPSQLRLVQATTLTILFLFCIGKRRCASLEDMLRCMAISLAVFIPLNVLVDGYFYLTLLLMLLLYVCVANDWWMTPEAPMTAGRENGRLPGRSALCM